MRILLGIPLRILEAAYALKAIKALKMLERIRGFCFKGLRSGILLEPKLDVEPKLEMANIAHLACWIKYLSWAIQPVLKTIMVSCHLSNLTTS